MLQLHPTARPDPCQVRLADCHRPRDHNARLGRCRGLKRTRPSHSHRPCPVAPPGRPGIQAADILPVPATGRYQQPARQRHGSPMPRTAVVGAGDQHGDRMATRGAHAHGTGDAGAMADGMFSKEEIAPLCDHATTLASRFRERWRQTARPVPRRGVRPGREARRLPRPMQ